MRWMMYWWWCEGGGDRAWWVIESVFLRSPDKGFWACLGDIPPDMPRRPETWVSLYNLMMKLCGISRSSAILGSDSPQSNNRKDHYLWVNVLFFSLKYISSLSFLRINGKATIGYRHDQLFNPLTAGVAYIRVFIFYLQNKYTPIKHVKDKMWHQSAIFENSWPLFCQIWIIFTHLKLWIASARHNFKWVKIQIE